jgi:murein DD-endopeptidase MepM/ murein hydrolase activator NlpD
MIPLPETPRFSVDSDETSLEPLLHEVLRMLRDARRAAGRALHDGLTQLAEDGLALRVATRPVRRYARRSVNPYLALLHHWAEPLHRAAEAFAAEFTDEARRAAQALALLMGQLFSVSVAGWVMALTATLRAGQRVRTWPTSALLMVVVVVDFLVAALIGVPVASYSPNVRAVLHNAPKQSLPLHTDWLPAYAAGAPPQNFAAESAGRLELAPTPLPHPVMTATPIPSVATAWLATLPLEPAWSGAGQCDGQWFVAPTGGGSFIWPADSRYLSGRNYYPAWHPGVDIAAQLGDPLYAADAGVVVYSGWNTQGYGNLIIVDHGNGWHTLYAHFSQLNVVCGDPVWQGQIIGLAGSTGNSTGPHLHFEVRGPGGRLSPWEVLP